MLIIDHKFIVKISLLSLKIPVLMFRLTRTVSNMRIAINNEETDRAYKYTVTRDLYSTIGNNTSDVKIFIIFQHITYGEVAGYSLRGQRFYPVLDPEPLTCCRLGCQVANNNMQKCSRGWPLELVR